MGEEQEQKFHQLTEEPVSRVISHLAVPCIISMLVTAFTTWRTPFVGCCAATLPLALWAWCFP
ncbi:MAG: hypothetical protein ACLTYN_09405 [Dysosmobacter welbionis]